MSVVLHEEVGTMPRNLGKDRRRPAPRSHCRSRAAKLSPGLQMRFITHMAFDKTALIPTKQYNSPASVPSSGKAVSARLEGSGEECTMTGSAKNLFGLSVLRRSDAHEGRQ
jgi:hypothetical protein